MSTDVIRRVLNSKFVPTLEQKLKQDQKVLKKAGLTQAVRQLQGSGENLKPLADHSISVPVLGDEASSKSQTRHAALKVIESNGHSINTPRRQTGRSKGIQDLEQSLVRVPAVSSHQGELQKYSTSGCQDTRAGSDTLPAGEKPEEQNFSSKVVQRGREFFDSNGNFLYRI